MKKEVKYVIFIMIFVLIAIKVLYTERFSMVKKAINMTKAERYIKEKDGYYIIKRNLHTDFSYYRNSTSGWTKMDYYGRTPGVELSSVFMAADNQYLVKAIMKEEAGETYLEIQEWDIIYPIKRAYAVEYSDTRIFYPFHKIDKFDEERGDYIEGLYDKEVIPIDEAKEKVENEPNKYFIIVPQKEEKIHWYLAVSNKKLTGEIELSGKSPDNYLSDVFMKGKMSEKNIFLVHGKYIEAENKIYVEDWNFINQILRFYNEEAEQELKDNKVFHTEFYLDKNDIKRGDYTPTGTNKTQK